MIPAPEGITVRYPASRGITENRVLAFDADGRPLVAGQYGLEPAEGFDYIEPGWTNPVKAMIPADGWKIEVTLEDGQSWSEPLVGWGLLVDGSVEPLVVEDGTVSTAESKWPVKHERRLYRDDD